MVRTKQLWVTHSGTFHVDDVLAYAMLSLAGGPHELVRTRDPEVIRRADIVWDVGGEFDHARCRFDHHQRGAPNRPDGTPYSSAGLVWLAYGRHVMPSCLGVEGTGELGSQIGALFDEEVIRRIDEIDNGVSAPGDRIGLADIVDDYNLPWDSHEVGRAEAEDARFREAALKAAEFVRHRMESIAARVRARELVAQAAAASPDPRILELDRKMPWQEGAFAAGLPVLYAVYPVPDGNWMVDAMPPQPGSYGQRLPLPEAWAGLRGDALAAECGVGDAVFVHPRRFIGVAGSKAGALEMAGRAMALAPDAVQTPGP